MQTIPKYMKMRGEQLDAEIAAATCLPLSTVRRHLTELSARGEVIVCHATRFNRGEKTEGLLCRVSGYIPAATPGRKPKARAQAEA
jgi:hypothetical protein